MATPLLIIMVHITTGFPQTGPYIDGIINRTDYDDRWIEVDRNGLK